MRKNKVAVPTGIDKDTHEIHSINDLDKSKSGLKCNLFCPNEKCEDRLLAIFSHTGKKVNYLKHYKKVATLACAESALHLQGKLVLSQQRSFYTSPHEIVPETEVKDILNISHLMLRKSIFGRTPIVFKGTPKLEKKIKNEVEIQGDLIVSCQFKDHVFDVNFEIKVTHKVDEEKLAKIQQLDITTIEIDISSLMDQGVLSDEVVLKAINDPLNHKVMHIAESLSQAVVAEYELEKQKKVNRENRRIEKRIYNLEQSWKDYGLKLPRYYYKLKRLPSDLKHHQIHIEKKKPQLPITVAVHSLVHNSDNQLDLTVCVEGNVKKIAVYITQDDNDLDKIKLSDISSLGLRYGDFLSTSSNCPIYWAFNNKANDYEAAYNSKVESEIKSFELRKKELAEVKKHEVLGILSDIRRKKYGLRLSANDCFHSPDKKAIEEKALMLISELKDMDVPHNIIQSLFISDVDPECIFGVMPNTWQIFIAYYVCTGGTMDDIAEVNKYLNKHGIGIVEPYKTALLKNKLFQEIKMELPFKTPYRILLDYKKKKSFLLKKLSKR